MDVLNFYNLIDNDIKTLVNEYKDNPFLKKQNAEGKKSFGFLLWFIKRYAPHISNIEDFITDGHDDASCDIIFSNKDNFGKTVFYIIQSKWCSSQNIHSSNGITHDIKVCLSDFRIVFNGDKTKSALNKKFNAKYDELLTHIEGNGETKFIFLTLGKSDHHAVDNIKEFITSVAPFEIIDINRLKRDYIEMEYKGARTHNPIETPYEPKGEIEIEFIEKNKISVISPWTSYIVLVKPKLIFDLFSKYGFSLFYSNIRNPLHASNFNEKISETIIDNPSYFWYFNNGITAITENIETIRVGSKVTVKGLQIINGAQTVYSIFSAYRDATTSQKDKMNNDALITLRLLKSGGKDFDLNVTRYTNSQNPVNERDFHANDDVQLRLQKDFFDNTDIWYERRRGEFRLKVKGVEILSNEDLAQTYLAYSVNDPLSAKNKSKMLFVSEKVDNEGLYEKMFNNKTKHEDMLASYYLYNFIEKRRRETNKRIKEIEPSGEYTKQEIEILKYEFLLHSSFHILSYFNVLLYNKYDPKSVSGRVISWFKKDEMRIIEEFYKKIIEKIKVHIEELKEEDSRFTLTRYFKSSSSDELADFF